MTLLTFAAATALLLLTPGPTNTLLAVAGAERGFARAIGLVRFELAAYLPVTFLLALFSVHLSSAIPHFKEAVTLLAGAWVALLAIRMWPRPAAAGFAAVGEVTGRLVFVTTLLNPKNLVIGMVLLPSGGSLLLREVVLAALIIVIASLWTALGGLVFAQSRVAPRALRQGAAIALGLLSLFILSAGLRAA